MPPFIQRVIKNPFTALLLTLSILPISCAAPPSRLGLVDTTLQPCPDRPNCVNSEEAKKPSFIAPISFTMSPEAAWQYIKRSVVDIGGNVEEEQKTYLRATFTSLIFRFKDDLELRLDAAHGLIHVRSASRLGYSDFGVNRRRVERLRIHFDKISQDHETIFE